MIIALSLDPVVAVSNSFITGEHGIFRIKDTGSRIREPDLYSEFFALAQDKVSGKHSPTVQEVVVRERMEHTLWPALLIIMRPSELI